MSRPKNLLHDLRTLIKGSGINCNARHRGGRPCAEGTGIPTTIFTQRLLAGETIETQAEDYEMDVSVIRLAVAFEAGRLYQLASVAQRDELAGVPKYLADLHRDPTQFTLSKVPDVDA